MKKMRQSSRKIRIDRREKRERKRKEIEDVLKINSVLDTRSSRPGS